MREQVDELELRAQERVGQVLQGKWRLERLLGVGGMAAVYAGVHRNGARSAIKVLHSHLTRHKEVRERFRREAYVSNKVDHPGAVRVLDDDVVSGGPEDGTAYLVMEMLDGEPLDARLERGPALDETEILRLMGSVLEVLAAAHAKGVVHRDLKPDNLFLAREEGEGPVRVRVKVLDFGMARLLDEQAITSYGIALGTPAYMAPEQAAGRNDEVDGRADLFALGATAFRARTGRRVHEADAMIEVVRRMAYEPAPPLRSVAPDASEAFARVVDKALQFKRQDRYANAEAMLEDVRRALEDLHGRETVRPPEQATIVLSSSDLEPWPGNGGVRTAAADKTVAAKSKAAPRTGVRRSRWRWVLVLLFAGVGAKVAYDTRTSPLIWPWTDVPEPPRAVTDAAVAPAPAATTTAREAGAATPTPAPIRPKPPVAPPGAAPKVAPSASVKHPH